MDIDRFWELIERARVSVGPGADQAVRDYDHPEDDPDRDYWDFDDLEIDAEALAAERRAGSEGSDDFATWAAGAADGAGDDAGGDGDSDDDHEEISDPIAAALVSVLAELDPSDIAAFEAIFDQLRAAADRDDIANAAVLIEHGFLGDDSFDDFRAGLVALGRTAYESALRDPDSLAGHPLVREIAQANDPRWLGREDLLYAASHAYAESTGEDEVTFFEVVDAQDAGVDVLDVQEPGDVEIADADEAEWAVTDEAETRRRLPNLSVLFYERSMRNRSRAMAKLGLRD